MIAQYIFDKIIGSSQPKSLIAKVFKMLRQQLLTSNDPVVQYAYKGSAI